MISQWKLDILYFLKENLGLNPIDVSFNYDFDDYKYVYIEYQYYGSTILYLLHLSIHLWDHPQILFHLHLTPIAPNETIQSYIERNFIPLPVSYL